MPSRVQSSLLPSVSYGQIEQWHDADCSTDVAGSRDRKDTTIYKCKNWPYYLWCQMSNYEPEVGLVWSNAWTNAGECNGQLNQLYHLLLLLKSFSRAKFSVIRTTKQYSILLPICPLLPSSSPFVLKRKNGFAGLQICQGSCPRTDEFCGVAYQIPNGKCDCLYDRLYCVDQK